MQLGLPQQSAALSTSFGQGPSSMPTPSPLTLMLQGQHPIPRRQRSNSSSSGGLNLSSHGATNFGGPSDFHPHSRDHQGGHPHHGSGSFHNSSGHPHNSGGSPQKNFGGLQSIYSGASFEQGRDANFESSPQDASHSPSKYGGRMGNARHEAQSTGSTTAAALAQAAELCAAVERGGQNSTGLGVTRPQGSNAEALAGKLRKTLAAIQGGKDSPVHSPFEDQAM